MRRLLDAVDADPFGAVLQRRVTRPVVERGLRAGVVRRVREHSRRANAAHVDDVALGLRQVRRGEFRQRDDAKQGVRTKMMHTNLRRLTAKT